MKWSGRLLIFGTMSILFYGFNWLKYLMDKAHMEALLQQGIALRWDDAFTMGVATQWWGPVLAIVLGVLSVAFIEFRFR